MLFSGYVIYLVLRRLLRIFYRKLWIPFVNRQKRLPWTLLVILLIIITSTYLLAHPPCSPFAKNNGNNPRLVLIINCESFKFQTGGISGISRIWKFLIPELVRIVALSLNGLVILIDYGNIPQSFHRFHLYSSNVLIVQASKEQQSLDEVHVVGSKHVTVIDEAIKAAERSSKCIDHNQYIYTSTYYDYMSKHKLCRIMMVYDFIPEHMRSLYFKLGHGLKEFQQKEESIPIVNSFISISKATKTFLSDLYKVPEQIISVVYPRLNPLYSKIPDSNEIENFRQLYNIFDDFILVVGERSYPHKNSLMTWLALQFIPESTRSNFTLILTGEALHESEQMLANSARVSVRHVHIMDQHMCQAYAASKALLYVSLEEGFGIPVIEAMSCGTLVITGNSTGMIEAGGDAAFYAEPTKPLDIARLVTKVIGLTKNERQSKIVLGEQQTVKFGHEFKYDSNSSHGWTEMASEFMAHVRYTPQKGQECLFAQ